jgi:hypothetical protein
MWLQNHGLDFKEINLDEGNEYAEAEWLSGWIALTVIPVPCNCFANL